MPDSTAYAEMAVASKTAHAAVAIRIVLEASATALLAPPPCSATTRLVGTKHMAADIYTKALDQQTFFSLRDYTLNLDGGPGSRVVLTGQTARLWKKLVFNN